MEFHEPDSRWAGFGCSSYEHYLDRYLIRGKFHNKVPNAVTDAYITIEYLMAHAYYFYPMYDEALSKLLRTMEMAVKLRCKEIGIDIVNRKKTSDKGIVNHDFKTLIDKLVEAEPTKKLESALHWSRRIRNFSMHPDANSYAGGTIIRAIISCVNTLNILFAPKKHFETFTDTLEDYNMRLQKLNGNPLVLEFNKNRIIIQNAEISDIFINGGEEKNCVFIQPVLDDLKKEDNEDFRFASPLTIYAKNLVFSESTLSGFDCLSSCEFRIALTDHPKNVKVFNEYKSYVENANNERFNPIISFINSERASAIANFRYNYYHQFICVEENNPTEIQNH